MDDAFPLLIHLFGPFEVRLHGQPLSRLHSRKVQWLLALLVLRHGREVERAWLAGTLWPDSSEEAAHASLRNSLKDLRRALGPEAGRLHSPTTRSLSLDLQGAHADVLAFDAAMANGDTATLVRAVELYRGPLLEGCAEEWAFQERQIREQAYLMALETLATQAMERGDLGAAERHLQRAVAVEPLRETAQRTLMQALAAGGNTAAAAQVYRELRLRLHRELNAEPDPETRALYERLRAEARTRGDTASGGGAHGAGRRDPPGHPVSAPPSPSGTLTFLFTDIEGSSQLWERHPQAMRAALEHHDALLRQSVQGHGGFVFKTVGDAFYSAFASAPTAVAAALEAQQALIAQEWGETGPLRVRMALHTGIAEERDGDYFGPTLNRVARLLEAGHGAQVLLSLPTEELGRDELPEGADLRPLGEHRLRDLVRPEQVFQILHPELPAEFPPLRSLAAFTHNLPVQWTSYVGREQEMAAVKGLLPTTPLLTLTGAGGSGKTRLAQQVAADLLEAYPDGAWLVELAALADPTLVPQTVAAALGVPEGPGRPLTATLIQHLRSRSLLLVLDNCEHLLSACAQLVEALLRACPNVRILATSRERLGLTGERIYPVPPLSLSELPPQSAAGAERVSAAMQAAAAHESEQATALAEESLVRARAAGDPWLVGSCLHVRGWAVRCQGDGERATSLFQDSLALMRQVGDKWNMVFGLLNLGGAAQARGDDEAARCAYQEGLALSHELRDRRGMAWILECLAEVAVAEDRPRQGARLMGAAEGLLDTIGASWPPNYVASRERTRAAICAALGEAAFTEARAEGRTMPLEQAIPDALMEPLPEE